MRRDRRLTSAIFLIANVAAVSLLAQAAPPTTSSVVHAQTPTVPPVLSESEIERRLDALWLPPGATRDLTAEIGGYDMYGLRVYVDGTAGLSFTAVAKRQDASGQIVGHFKQLGWRQRPNQLWNPQLATSFARGWEHRCACVVLLDAAGKPIHRDPLYKWWGEWESDRGEVVIYSLRSQGGTVTASASYYPPHPH